MAATHADLLFTPESPERGWEPFISWLLDQGIDPHECRSILVRADGSAVATMLRRTNGRPQIVGGEIVTYHRRITKITGPPPLRTDRS